MEAIVENSDKSNDNNNGSNEPNNANNDDMNEETNKDTNEETNEDNDEENADFFSTVFGDEEDREDGSDDNEEVEECEDESESLAESKANIFKQTERPKDWVNNSSKRRSDERDCSQSKRIKAEPMDKPAQTSTNRLTTTCVPIKDQTIDIPKNSFEFMNYLLDLNANDLESKDMKDIEMFEKLQNISNRFQFEDLQSFREVFIPYILMDLWLKIKQKYVERQNSGPKGKEVKHLYSILTKSKTSKMKKGLEIRCISFLRPNETPVFKFGQLVTIQTAVQSRPNSNAHMITRKKYFGYVSNHSIRGFNCENQSEVNHLRLRNEEKRNSILIEEILFMSKYSEEIYLRNDALIVVEPVISLHNYYMQVRALFKFEQFPIWQQVLNPIYSSKASGVMIAINDKKFDETQTELIQIALDVVANPISSSCFMAINGPNDSGKTALLIEVMRQIVRCESFKQPKILFISSSESSLKSIEQKLKSHRIVCHWVDNNPRKLRDPAIKYITNKMAKTADDDKRNQYEECLQYFESYMTCELTVETALLKNTVVEQLKHDLMATSSVIIGRIEDLCNDISFYKDFANHNKFKCCVIDEALDITEPQLYSLFWFGINKFLISADISELNSDETDICRRMALSRSFFERYYTFGSQNTQNSTVFNV